MRKRFLVHTGLCLALFSISSLGSINGQTMPEVMNTGSMEEQVTYLREKMNIYNGYRAVRDDIFLKMTGNSLDSLNKAKAEINGLIQETSRLGGEIKQLNNQLKDTGEERDLAVKNRDSLSFFGIPMAKTLYNMIVWGIILGLLFLLVFGGILFKANRKKTSDTLKDLEETRLEFENFRKSTREKTEQMVINHFNEIKKLKEGRV